jgi:hypothetical protein
MDAAPGPAPEGLPRDRRPRGTASPAAPHLPPSHPPSPPRGETRPPIGSPDGVIVSHASAPGARRTEWTPGDDDRTSPVGTDAARRTRTHEAPAAMGRRGLLQGWKTGLEPATSGTTIRRSNQLSYIHRVTSSPRTRLSCAPNDTWNLSARRHFRKWWPTIRRRGRSAESPSDGRHAPASPDYACSAAGSPVDGEGEMNGPALGGAPARPHHRPAAEISSGGGRRRAPRRSRRWCRWPRSSRRR